MAAADCDMCKALGYRSCDLCGGVVIKPHRLVGDVCGYCWGRKALVVDPPIDTDQLRRRQR
jgi:hypothetical protein